MLKTRSTILVLSTLLLACASSDHSAETVLQAIPAAAQTPEGDLSLAIRSPEDSVMLMGWQSEIELRGAASVYGGVEYLDLMLAIDTSRSLSQTDPEDFRAAGAIGLIESLPLSNQLRVGVVDFDGKARLVQSLTPDRSAVIEQIRSLDRRGDTNLADGIRTSLAELLRAGRPDTSRVILLFTDGRSDAKKARVAMQEARAAGVAIHTLLLGRGKDGADILAEIATGTGGSFIPVSDPKALPDAFLNLRTTGVERLTVRVNESEPIEARLVAGTFTQNVPLEFGENQIVVTATSLTGQHREQRRTVTVSGPLRIVIESPVDGAGIEEQSTELLVEGHVDPFAGLSSEAAVRWAELGIRDVILQVADAPPFTASVTGNRFSGRIQITPGENQIKALATTLDGRSASDRVTVDLRAPGCAELEVNAFRDGNPALSVSDRSVEIVVDGSNSMWGRMEGRPKIGVAREILQDALEWLDDDVRLALRAYGHRHPRKQRNCTDSELLVPFGERNRGQIRAALDGLKPRGQTPLAYSLGQIASELGSGRGERAVVLVTDGVESCGGDPVEPARTLGGLGIPVHVIGFGLGNELDENSGALADIARVSGGRFILARSADDLRSALATTVGTKYRILRESEIIAEGALGSHEAVQLSEGRYRVQLLSEPPHETPVTLAGGQRMTLSWQRQGSSVRPSSETQPIDYTACWETTAPAVVPGSPESADPASPSRE